VRVETDPAQPLARQATRLTLEACDDGSLNWERPVLPTHEGFSLRPLGEQQLDVERDGVMCTAHHWHWALLPTAAGTVDLALPWLKAGKFGAQLRFPPPTATLDIHPLPAWLPAEVAIGRPAVVASPLPADWPLERPLAWHLEITGGYTAAGLKALLRLQLAPYPALNAYPPTVEVLAPEDRNSPLTRLAVTLYALPQATGDLALPDLTLSWYDPATGRLENLALSGPRIKIFTPLHDTLLRWGVGLSIGALLGLAAWRLKKALSWRLARRRGLQAIARTRSPVELARALRAFTLTSRARPTASLGLWQADMARQVHCPGLEGLVLEVEQACYGLETTPEGLKARALGLLARARPIPSRLR
jgi:hypothetical protein